LLLLAVCCAAAGGTGEARAQTLAEQTVVFLDDELTLRAGEVRTFHLVLQQRAATLDGNFEVTPAQPGLRMLVFQRDRDHWEGTGAMTQDIPLFSTRLARSGQFHYTFQTPGDYVLVLDNTSQAARVKMEARLIFSPAQARTANVEQAPLWRRVSIAVLSLGFFGFAIAFFLARLRRALRQRHEQLRGWRPPFS
jgi:hypothetical protein